MGAHLTDLGIPVDDHLGKVLALTDFASPEDRRRLLSELREVPEGRDLISELYDANKGVRSVDDVNKAIVQAALFPDD